MRQWISAAVIAVVFMAATVPALACSCIQFSNARDHLRNTDVVFIGRVVRTERDWFNWDRMYTTFEVGEVLRGNAPRRVRVSHSDGNICCMCGMSFERGTRAMVFAHRSDNNGLSTSSCSAQQFSEAEYRAALRPVYQ